MKNLIIILLFITNSVCASLVEKVAAESVASGSVHIVSYTPDVGKEITLKWFEGNAAQTPDTTVAVIWKLGTASEDIIWATHGSIAIEEDILIGTGDGSLSIGLCLINDDSISRILSGKMRIQEK